jgi:predicted alpha/beta hydrolase
LPLVGYFPGRRLRLVGDLPRAVMAQWRRWCLHPQYAIGVEGEAVRAQFASLTTPIVSLSFTDDEFMSARNIESLHDFFSAAPKQMIRLTPAEVGEPRIGHFGFFRARLKETLWRPYLLPALAR